MQLDVELTKVKQVTNSSEQKSIFITSTVVKTKHTLKTSR